MIDLHLHSTASDGTLSPAALVRLAKDGGLRAIALTDHDTMAGVPEAVAEGARVGIEVIPGVEISIDHKNTFHVIGLFVDAEEKALGSALARVRDGRADRNRRLAARLTELGKPVSLAEVESLAGGDVVARPHFAQALVDRGYVSSTKEAFDRLIGKGRPGYVDRSRLEVEEALLLISGAGGVSVLCHPATLKLDMAEGARGPDALLTFARDLREKGLDAIEVFYPDHDSATAARLRAVAREAGLLLSGGSDYHGHTKKDAKNGVGGLDIPYSALEALRERAISRRSGEG
jgi:predicted metal-dependent phosphoesterase TrpH